MSFFTIGVLTFGDHAPLLQRCLRSLQQYAEWPLVRELRIGLNQAYAATKQLVAEFAKSSPVPVTVFSSAFNEFKYPMMRKMLYAPGHVVSTPYFMWFDDDSFLRGHGVLTRCRQILETGEQPVVARPYKLSNGYQGQQVEWIMSQPWYGGKPIALRDPHCTWFPQGAWWAAQTAFLGEHNWPHPQLRHRGGDVMLGALLRQTKDFYRFTEDTVAVNADAAGRHSRSPRRGFDEKPLGVKLPPPPVNHDFEYDVVTWPGVLLTEPLARTL